jgi:hypothetical protein
MLHSLEQLFFAAPRKWVHLCLAHGIDWPFLPHSGAMLPLPNLWPMAKYASTRWQPKRREQSAVGRADAEFDPWTL